MGALSNREAAGPQFRTSAERSSSSGGRNGTGFEDAPVPERSSLKKKRCRIILPT